MTSRSGTTEQIDPATKRGFDAISAGSNTDMAIGTTGWVMIVHMNHICTDAGEAQRQDRTLTEKSFFNYLAL